MTFLHAAFLAGTAAIAIPIVLHLIMRQQPKHLEFPALRFVKLRQTANRRQVRFRHWLLLALRCAIIGLLAMALARPSIVASGVLGDQESPVAAALVFDTNPRMQYRHQNETRLEAARETAQWLLPQLPLESEVAVVDARTGTAAFAVGLSAARQRIDRLDDSAMTQPLALAIESSLKLVAESDKARKEVYIFTDLSRATWSADSMREVARQLKNHADVGIYLIDVGVESPTDFGLGALRLSGEVLSRNSKLRIESDLTHVGVGDERSVELYLLEAGSDQPSMRGQKTFAFQSGESARAEFELGGLPKGLHQGYLKLVGEDPLACDDQRWFTVEVRPAWRVLIAAPAGTPRRPHDYALFLAEALAPHARRVKGEAPFECEIVTTDMLAEQPLDAYAAICLVDPKPLAGEVWQRLHSYVSAGGGLGIFLGQNATPISAMNEPLAQQVLPGPLVRQWRASGEVYLAPDELGHPLLARFRRLQTGVPWDVMPVFKHWQLGELAKDALVVAPFSDNRAAIIDRPIGKGHVVTMTTPVSDAATRDAWNLLPTAEGAWPFQQLMHGIVDYLVGSGDQRLNYTTGDTAIVRPETAQEHPIYSLTTPKGEQIRMPLNEQHDTVSVTATETPGNYRLRAGGGENKVELGFSANFPDDVSQLERATGDDLKAIFGETPFRLARNRDEIDRSVSAGRVGQELFPYLILLVAFILGCEQVLSNRFYQDYGTGQESSRAAQLARGTVAARSPERDVPAAAR